MNISSLFKTKFFPAAILIAAALPVAVVAQWPTYTPPGTPRTADGKVDMNAPAPRLANGKPDLSGLWTGVGRGGPPAGGGLGGAPVEGAPAAGRGGPPAGAAAGGPPAGAPAAAAAGRAGRGAAAAAPGTIPAANYINLGGQFEGGLLPYTPAGLKLRTERFNRHSIDHPDAHCLPINPIHIWGHPQPRKLVQTPNELVFIAEANSVVRQIFTDGRTLPKVEDVQPWWFAYSVGKWEGDTLVVDTIGFLDDAWIDENGSPLSNGAHLTERFTRPNYGSLHVEMTVTDPKFYTRPFTVQVNQQLMPSDQLIEFICAENNKAAEHYSPK